MMLAKKRINPLIVVLGVSAICFILFLVISGILFLRQSSDGRIKDTAFFGKSGTVAVVELNGPILESKKILQRLKNFETRQYVQAVVLRINSPGGAVAPSQEIYEAVKKYKKPLVISMSSVAASGAFYIACGAKKVFANPGTITGSIGVVMEFVNLEDLYQWAKIRRYVMKTGKFKDVGAEYRKMTDEERTLLQTMIDDVLLQFKKAVADGRKLSMSAVNNIADGRIFSGSQAYRLKLVDQLGTLDDAVNEAAKMAGIEGEPQIVYPETSKYKWLEQFFDFNSADDEGKDGSFFQEMFRSVILSLFTNRSNMEHLSSFREIPGIFWLWNGAR